MKEEVGIAYALGSKYNGKGWTEPLIIRNGVGEIFEIRAVVDKIGGRNFCTVVKKTAAGSNDSFTEGETHLPYNDNVIDLADIKLVLIKYGLLNTHVTFLSSSSPATV